MAKRSRKKLPKTDIIDAVVQDAELTVEQVETVVKEAAESAGRALTKVIKPKEMAPGSAPLAEDQRFKVPSE
ncbi:MAG TPA: hypothetical protein VMU41_03345 [Candidatus Binataceae bacterium]|nr:hypothetical protein [Candidatus Binataceae bacterium]